jgi:hypothetical protein
MNKMSWKDADSLLWGLETVLEKAVELREVELAGNPIYTDAAGELLNVTYGLTYSISHLKDAVRLHNHEVNQEEYNDEV